MKQTVELVNDELTARRCRRFWYDVYVLEMGRHLDEDGLANHVGNELSDPYTRSADLFAASTNDNVIGTLQSIYVARGNCDKYLSLYGLQNRSTADHAVISVTNKLMVAPQYRASGLAFRLAAATYRKGLRDGIEENYIDCNDYLIEFYKRIGYREHLGWIEHVDYGRVYSMVFELHGVQQMRRVRSPLLKLYQSHLNSPTQTEGVTVHG
ncbi:MAG: GNAT family N-acetyltransferase [Pseudomonadota bacterium]